MLLNIYFLKRLDLFFQKLKNFNWNSDYYWRVRPIYNNSTSGDWIGESTFSVKRHPESTPLPDG